VKSVGACCALAEHGEPVLKIMKFYIPFTYLIPKKINQTHGSSNKDIKQLIQINHYFIRAGHQMMYYSTTGRKTFKKLYEQKDLVRNTKDQYGAVCETI